MEGINQRTQKTLALDTGAKGETVITKANKDWLDQKTDNDKWAIKKLKWNARSVKKLEPNHQN